MVLVRLLVLISILFLAACGGQESGGGSAEEEAVAPLAAATDDWDEDEEDLGESDVNPAVPHCLELVAAGEFAEARTRCLEAARVDPENAEVAAALEAAKSAEVTIPVP